LVCTHFSVLSHTLCPEIFSSSGSIALKEATIETVVALEGTDIQADGLETFAVLCMDDAGDVRLCMRKKFIPRFLSESSDPELADRLRTRILKVVLGRLINSHSIEEKMAALQIAGGLGRCDDTLIDVLLTLLDSDVPELRIAVFNCLDSVRCIRPDAIAAGLRFVHSSALNLRDAACVFAFNACVNQCMEVQGCDDGRAALDAAVWHLQHESRTGREIEKVRFAAVGLLRHAAAVLIRASQDTAVKHDSLDIKDTVATFLRSASCRRDTVELQRYAWTLLTDFFAMDEPDLALFTDCFSLSRPASSSAVMGRDVYDRSFMAELLPRIRVCNARDCSFLLEAMVVDKLLAHLFLEPVLRYAQIPDRELPRDWGRLHAAIRPRQPLVATLLAAEFTAAAGCAPPVVPPELQARTARPAAVARAIASTASVSSASVPAGGAARSAATPSALAQAMAASATVATGVAVANAPLLVRNAPTDTASSEALVAAERKAQTLEKTLAAITAQFNEAKDKLSQSQKVGRDERRARLLLEERCRELSTKLKQQQARLQRMEEAHAATEVASPAHAPTLSTATASASAGPMSAPFPSMRSSGPSDGPSAATPVAPVAGDTRSSPLLLRSAPSTTAATPTSKARSPSPEALPTSSQDGPATSRAPRKKWERPTSMVLPSASAPSLGECVCVCVCVCVLPSHHLPGLNVADTRGKSLHAPKKVNAGASVISCTHIHTHSHTCTHTHTHTHTSLTSPRVRCRATRVAARMSAPKPPPHPLLHQPSHRRPPIPSRQWKYPRR
jgi:hypothetical protein